MKIDLGPYNSTSQIKGARYTIITPSGEPFMARIVAEVPDLETAREIVRVWNDGGRAGDEMSDTPRPSWQFYDQGFRDGIAASAKDRQRLERENEELRQENKAVSQVLEERNALLADLRKCEQQLIACGAREQALADALQLVLDDWANSNSILDDAMDRAHAALAMRAEGTR